METISRQTIRAPYRIQEANSGTVDVMATRMHSRYIVYFSCARKLIVSRQTRSNHRIQVTTALFSGRSLAMAGAQVTQFRNQEHHKLAYVKLITVIRCFYFDAAWAKTVITCT